MLLSERASQASSTADEHLRQLVHSFLEVGCRVSRLTVACTARRTDGRTQVLNVLACAAQACHHWCRQNPRLVRTVFAQLPVRLGYPPRSAPAADLPQRVLVSTVHILIQRFFPACRAHICKHMTSRQCIESSTFEQRTQSSYVLRQHGHGSSGKAGQVPACTSMISYLARN